MFQFHYFILFVAFGFGSGYTNPSVPEDRIKPVSFLFFPMSIIGLIAIIWSFFSLYISYAMQLIIKIAGWVYLVLLIFSIGPFEIIS